MIPTRCDMVSSLVEFNNVIAGGGSPADFAESASDPESDGVMDEGGGCGAGSPGFGRGVARGDLLMFGLLALVPFGVRGRRA